MTSKLGENVCKEVWGEVRVQAWNAVWEEGWLEVLNELGGEVRDKVSKKLYNLTGIWL